MSDDKSNPQPDLTTIRAHLERLFRRARIEYPEGRCEIAWADHKGAVNSAETFGLDPDSLDAATIAAARYNAAGRNTYVGVNPRKPSSPPFGRASATDVEIAFVQFIDGDSPQTADKLRRAPIPYSWAVTTGRIPNPRPQAYWDLEEPTRNLKAWSDRQLALAEFFGADHVIDPPRVMRLAGTVNYPTLGKIKNYPDRIIESVTLRTLYDGAEREPLAWEVLDRAYPNVKPNGYTNGHAGNGHDPDTGEIFEEQRQSRPNFHTGISIKSLIQTMAAGQGGWHKAALALTGHMINRGDPDALILALAPGLTTSGYTVAETHAELSKMILSARINWNIPNHDEDFSAETADGNPLMVRPLGLLNPSARATRDWLVPDRMMRRHITMTTAAPGVGKSTLAIEEAVSLASGIDFLNFGITKPHRVAVINNEETRDELERRIEATCQHFNVPLAAIAETFFLYSGVDAEKIILARSDRNGNVTPTIRVDQFRSLVQDQHLDLVILDPFVQLHYVEESANDQISQAMVHIRTIGSGERSAAIHLIHHNRKPVAGNSHQAGDMNAARGASSMGGEAHFFFTLTDMGAQDGENLNIPEDERVNYLRLDNAKRKMSPATGALWYQRQGIHMPYGLMGEEVGILVPREMGEIKHDITYSTASTLLTAINEAWGNGNPYSDSPRAHSRYVVHMMMRDPYKLTRLAGQTLMNDWLANGILVSEVRNSNLKLRGLRVQKWPG